MKKKAAHQSPDRFCGRSGLITLLPMVWFVICQTKEAHLSFPRLLSSSSGGTITGNLHEISRSSSNSGRTGSNKDPALLCCRGRRGVINLPHRPDKDQAPTPRRVPFSIPLNNRVPCHRRHHPPTGTSGPLPGPLSGDHPAPLLHSDQNRRVRESKECGRRRIPFSLRQGSRRWRLRRNCSVFLQVVASPADLVKVRMQGDGLNLIRGLPPRYSGPFDALNKIVHTEGIRGLWRGVLPNAQRAFLVNMGELACYDQAKHFIIQHEICKDNIFAHTLASMMSGLAATTLSCPADVVKTRMMNQAVGKDCKAVMYSSSYDCLVKTVRVEGLKALWKGFFPTWARLGPWQFVFWVSYEKFRKLAGLSSF